MGRIAVRCLDAAPPDWEALASADPDATAAHRPEVWRALCDTLGMALKFVAVEIDGRLAGGGAALVERRIGLHWIHGLPFLLSGAPLARHDVRAEVELAVGGMLRRLQAELGAVGGEWVLYRPSGAPVEMRAAETLPGENRWLETMLIDLGPGIPCLWRRLDRDTRHELRAARARGLFFAEEPTALEEAYALHLGQARHWPGFRPLPLELSRRLLASTGAHDGAPAGRLFTVRDARGLVSATLFLDHPRELFAWWSGTTSSTRARHATSFLLWSVTEWASETGHHRMNLGGSSGRASLTAFKESLGGRSHRYLVRWLAAPSAAGPASVVARLQQRLRRDRHRGEPT